MQFCATHWDQLRQAVDLRGMSHLVAKSAKQAAEDLTAQIQGTDSVDNWDPLMQAHWSILTRALEALGVGALTSPGCPLCEVQKVFDAFLAEQPPEEHAQYYNPTLWIDDCVDSMLVYARENGLVPKEQ